MNSKPFISVVIPAYQSSDTLIRAIDSVLNQSHQDFEIIVVDNASTDNTQSIVDMASKVDRRIRYAYLQKNLGPGGARNAGCAIAEGEIIAFLDADDAWKTNKLQSQVDAFTSFPQASVVFSDRCLVVTSEEKSKNECLYPYLIDVGLKLEKAELDGNTYLIDGPLQHVIYKKCFISTSSVMVRKKAFNDVGGFNQIRRGTEDIDLWVRLARNHKFVYQKQNLAYQFRTGSSTSAMSEQWLNELLSYHLMCLYSSDYINVNRLALDNLKKVYRYLIVYYGSRWKPIQAVETFMKAPSMVRDLRLLFYTLLSIGGPLPYKVGEKILRAIRR